MRILLKSEKLQVVQHFEELSDEELVEQVHLGNTDALDYLITKYRLFVKVKARSYFLIGADKEDIIQEGMIGLYKSIRDFRGTSLHHSELLLNCA